MNSGANTSMEDGRCKAGIVKSRYIVAGCGYYSRMRAFSLGSAQDTCRRLLRGRSVSRADEVQQQQQQAGTPSTSFKIKTWNGTATEWNHGREGRRETSTADAYGLQRVLAAHRHGLV
jgi:hypothetical protein